jgi:hypothetical protein
VRLICLHTAQGSRTFQSLGNFFASSSAGVSSHAGIDDTPGVIGVYVRRQDKAWTQGDANPYTVAAELCAFAEWDAAEWNRHPAMLENAGRWVGEEAAAFGIPLVILTAAEAQGGAAGVCQHADLGAMGGGHWDCGPAFPIGRVLEIAAGGAGAPAPTKRKGRQMIASTDGDGYWTVTSDGAVYAFGDAEHHGGANAPDVIPPGHEIIGIAGHGRDGYWLFGSDGSVYAYGSATYAGRPDRA